MAITTQERTNILKLVAGLFNAAPGAAYLSEFTTSYQALNGNLANLATALGNTGAFKSLYPNTLTSAEFATKFLTTLGLQNNTEAKDWVQAKVNGGASYSSVIFQALAAIDASTSADFANAKAQLANKAAVAEYYSVPAPTGLGLSSDQLATLQGVVANVDHTQASVDAAKASAGNGSVVTLTNGADKLTSNIFDAPQVYTPAGNDRINSLQNDDELTGVGTNATLNAVLGNVGDNGATTITPTLKGIQTINARFDNTVADMTLDLQDSTGVKVINVTRIADGRSAIVQNIAEAATDLSIANSHAPEGNVTFSFLGSAVAGGADAVNLKLSNVNVNNVRVEERGAAPAEGFETINLNSTGSANKVNVLQAEDLKTLNITGDKDLTLGGTAVVRGGNNQTVEATRYNAGLANVAGSLTTIDASNFEGKLDITLGGEINAGADNTSGVPVQFTVKGGKADDTIRLVNTVVGGTVNNTDKIDGGAGANKVVILGGTTIEAAAAPTVTNVQKLEIRTGHDLAGAAVTVNADAFDKLESIFVRNEGNNLVAGAYESAAKPVAVTLNNLTVAQAAGLTVAHGNTGNNALGSLALTAALKVATGANDTVAVDIVEGVNSDERFNFQLNTNAVENITLKDSDNESNTVQLNNVAAHTGTVTLTGGRAGNFLNLDATGNIARKDVSGKEVDTLVANGYRDVGAGAAERLVAKTIDASGYLGDVIVRVANGNTTDTTGAQTITMGSGNDWVIFDTLNNATAGLTISDKVDGGAGNDTLAIDGHGTRVSISASEWTNVKNFETIHLVGNGQTDNNGLNQINAYNLTLTNDFITNNGVAVTGGRLINIVNDNDTTNTVAGAIASGNTGVTIDARSLSAERNFSYNGQEGAAATADRFIMSDANVNGLAVIDGGAVNTTGGANADVLEVRNAAVVTIGDLVGVSNVGTLEFTNDQAAAQTSTLVLDSTTVERLVNSQHTATMAEPETLRVVATDNTAIGIASALNIDAGAVTGFVSLNITGSALGNDVVTLNTNIGGSSTTANLGASTGDRVNWVGGSATTTVTIDLAAGTHQFTDGGVTITHNIIGADIVDLSGMAYLNTRLSGSAGVADTLTGYAGVDIFGTGSNLGAQGQGVAATAETLTNVVTNGQTLTFGNGVDIINGFTSGTDKLDVATPGAATNLIGGDATQFGMLNTTYILRGTFVDGVFTVNGGATAATANVATALVVGDNTTPLQASSGWVILTGVAFLAAGDLI